jgi:hypothetical protein
MRLEFAEGRLDWVEVWRIRWKVKHRCTCRFDRLRDASDLVGWKIVHDDDVARGSGQRIVSHIRVIWRLNLTALLPPELNECVPICSHDDP